MSPEGDRGGGTRAAKLVAAGFLLNLAWEYAQWPLYGCKEGRPSGRVLMTLGAAAADAALIVGAHSLGARAFADAHWIQTLDGQKLLLTATTGTLIGTVIEKAALSRRWWEYHQQMPLLPRLGVGLLPVLQMALVPVLTFRLSGRWRP